VSLFLPYFPLRYLLDFKDLSLMRGQACPFFKDFLSKIFTLRVSQPHLFIGVLRIYFKKTISWNGDSDSGPLIALILHSQNST